MENSRTVNTIRNFTSGAMVQIFNRLFAFVVRTVFIQTLSTEYLGVNGLFTNILTILSFAELGFGTTIIYSMYKPVANNDKEKIKGLMDLYKKVYRIIGIVIAICGICVVPFLKYIIKDAPDIPESLTFIYLLFLLNTVLSYFYTYKKSIITAYQKESIINKYNTIVYIIQAVLQIAFLYITKNYIIYLLIQIICVVAGNIAISIKADKMYPYLREKEIEKISKEEKKGIFRNVKAMTLYKFGQTIMNGTDNIIVSAMFGVSIVGLCSNYTLIITSVVAVITSALNSITASIGNLNVQANREHKEDVFYEVFFASFIIYNFCSLAIIILINPFIKLWIGEQYLMEYSVVFALGLSMFIDGIRFAGYTYRTTLGLFVKGRMAPLISAIINIILSIVLGKIMGVAGVFIATSISRLVTTTWIDPYLIHKYEFKTSLIKFFKKYVKYIIIYFAGFIACYFITENLPTTGVIDLILRGIIVVIVPNTIMFLVCYRSKEFKDLYDRVRKLLKFKESEV